MLISDDDDDAAQQAHAKVIIWIICRRRILKHPRSCLGEKRGNHETNLQQSHPRTGHTREQDAKRTREQDAKQTHERRHESTGTKVQSAQPNHQSASKATTTHGHTHSQPPHAPTRSAPELVSWQDPKVAT